MHATTRSARVPRARKACDRCRRHKSRCDDFRPCSICSRANVECITSSVDSEPSNKKRRINQGTSMPGNNADESPDVQIPQHEPHNDYDDETTSPQPTKRVQLNVDTDAYVNTPNTLPSGSEVSPVRHRAAQSLMGFARKIFQVNKQKVDGLATSAIPDEGDQDDDQSLNDTYGQRRPIEAVLGCALPEFSEIRALLEEYFDSVHWFSLVIYEPRFRIQLESVRDGQARQNQRAFLTLLAMVLGLGSWYLSKRDTAIRNQEPVYWAGWSSKLISHVQSETFAILNSNTLESIQTCLLLGTHNTYDGKPKAAFTLLGATIKAAQAMGLHREQSDRNFDCCEERRRTWWTIYTWDRWASITYGRPLGINDKDCNISMPSDVMECRVFTNADIHMDSRCICYSPYQRELNKLYLIASPVIKTIFGLRNLGLSNQHAENIYWEQLRKVEDGLSQWVNDLPPHLAFVFDQDIDRNASPTTRAHTLQAMALQLTYDHLRIIFHRPFLAQQVMGLSDQGSGNNHISPGSTSTTLGDSQLSASSVLSKPQELSSPEHWWQAAIRTSKLTRLSNLVELASQGHLVAFTGINLFNSAVVLVIYALTNPLSDRAQESKRNVTLISQSQELLGRRSQLARQCSLLLKSMIMMIIKREAEAMFNFGHPSPLDSERHAIVHQAERPFSAADNSLLPSTGTTTPQFGMTTLSQEANRLNECMASLQKEIFAEPDSSLSLGSQIQQHNSEASWFDPISGEAVLQGSATHAGLEFSDSADDMFWMWSSMDNNFV